MAYEATTDRPNGKPPLNSCPFESLRTLWMIVWVLGMRIRRGNNSFGHFGNPLSPVGDDGFAAPDFPGSAFSVTNYEGNGINYANTRPSAGNPS